MELKEIGGVTVLVIGGAVYGISQYGLNDVLSEELRHISTVSATERPAYMLDVVEEFSEAFQIYSVETETYLYVGYSDFKTSPATGTFVEFIRSEEPVPQAEIKGIQTAMDKDSFCEQAEMKMFTDQGWAYRFSMADSTGRQIFTAHCRPAKSPENSRLELRGLS